MNNKVLIQLLLFISLIFASGIYYYFYKETKNINDNIKSDTKVSINENASNLIENIFYKSTDSFGNIFEIKSLTGEINVKKPDIVFMQNVEAIIYLTDSSPIVIKSNYANYNKNDFETNFRENVIVSYMDNEIKSENLDLSFKNNLATIYNKIIYNNNNTELKADILEIDLITKNSKIFMYNDYNKIKVSTKN